MSSREKLSPEMLSTLRTMALHIIPEKHGVWRLFGYIDWLEDRLDDVRPEWREEEE